jgi:nitrite reductase (NADH) small subunit
MTLHAPHSLRNLRTRDLRTVARQGNWVPVCRTEQLRVDVGVAALVGCQQVALFRLDVGEIRAIGNRDPYSRANILSRGIVGSRGEKVFVASPMYKQPFDLRTGECLDDPTVSVPTFRVRVVDGVVQVLSTPSPMTADAVTSDAVSASRTGSDTPTLDPESPDAESPGG